MIPWLLVAELISISGKPLSSFVESFMQAYPASGEINREVPDATQALAMIRQTYEDTALLIDETDGVSLEFENWRFNLRASNTEPVIRLNVESRGDEALMRQKVSEILALIDELA
jgi:phosphomannomutase